MKVNIALIQMSMSDNVEENRRTALAEIKNAAKKGANIVCFPELFTSPYFPQEENVDAEKYAETEDGKTINELKKAAKENKVVIISGSIYEKEGGKFYNTAFVINELGVVLGKYQKMHIPHDPQFYERNYFEEGKTGYTVFDTRYGKIAVLICYDQWYPEAARIVALKGADILVYPTAIGLVEGVEQSEGDWQNAWETVQRGHAIANNVIVAAINRVGGENRMKFWGGSFISSQFGTILAKGSNKKEMVIAEVDLQLGKEIRDGWKFFRHRRPETYGKITEKQGSL